MDMKLITTLTTVHQRTKYITSHGHISSLVADIVLNQCSCEIMCNHDLQ
jgi:hypothetical protein